MTSNVLMGTLNPTLSLTHHYGHPFSNQVTLTFDLLDQKSTKPDCLEVITSTNLLTLA